jgi:hypothetical protein
MNHARKSLSGTAIGQQFTLPVKIQVRTKAVNPIWVVIVYNNKDNNYPIKGNTT